MVDENEDARADRLCFHKSQGVMVAPIIEEVFSNPQDHRIDHQSIFIDEIMLYQQMDKVAAAGDQNIPTRHRFQFGYLFNNIGPDLRCIVPLSLFKGCRNNVLRMLFILSANSPS